MGICVSQNQIKKVICKVIAEQVERKVGAPAPMENIEKEEKIREKVGSREITQPVQVQDQPKTPEAFREDEKFQHPDNPHRSMFQITSTLSSSRIVFINFSDTNCYNCVKNESLSANNLTVFKLKQTKTLKQHVFMGIATQSIIINPKNWSQMIAYSSNNGQMWQNGSWSGKGDKVNDGDVMIIKVDTNKWIIYWKIESKEWRSEIPYKMRGKKLFLVIMFHDQNDTIQLLN